MTTDELRSSIENGSVSFEDYVWREGMVDWQPAASVAELVPVAAVHSPDSGPGLDRSAEHLSEAPVDADGSEIASGTVADALPSNAYVPLFTRHRRGSIAGQAILALVLALVGFYFFSILLEPVALITGLLALRKMYLTGDFVGRGFAVAAVAISLGVHALLLYAQYVMPRQ